MVMLAGMFEGKEGSTGSQIEEILDNICWGAMVKAGVVATLRPYAKPTFQDYFNAQFAKDVQKWLYKKAGGYISKARGDMSRGTFRHIVDRLIRMRMILAAWKSMLGKLDKGPEKDELAKQGRAVNFKLVELERALAASPMVRTLAKDQNFNAWMEGLGGHLELPEIYRALS